MPYSRARVGTDDTGLVTTTVRPLPLSPAGQLLSGELLASRPGAMLSFIRMQDPSHSAP